MRTQDFPIFSGTAQLFKVWILVRESNEGSIEYVGDPAYVSKPIDCKAKTALVNSSLPKFKDYKIAGLVANPDFYTDVAVYPPERAVWWKKFLIGKGIKSLHPTPMGYGLETNPKSLHYNCLTLNGKFIYGDYDLFDIVIKGQESRNLGSVETLNGEVHVRGARVNPVRKHLNMLLGFDMVNHGGAAQYQLKFERVHVFTPEGLHKIWEEQDIRNQYALWKRQLIELPPLQSS